jgi:ectoine hydroxylase-related dioxygenase (phytanoyl-CoA dioxygenase family)
MYSCYRKNNIHERLVEIMLTKDQLKHFTEEGYVILEGAFSAAAMENLTRRIDYYVDEHVQKIAGVGGDNGVSRAKEITFTPHLVKKEEVFQQFVSQPLFVEITTQLLGPDVSLYHDQAVYKRPETNKEFPWHQDNGYGLVLSEQYVTCWLALEDATVENGCIWVKPGTHKDGVVKHEKTPIGWQCYHGEDQGIPVPLKKGDMVVFSSLLFHKSGPNVSNTIRKGYIVQFFPTQAVNAQTGNPFKKIAITKKGAAHLDLAYLEDQSDVEGLVKS